MRKPRPKSAVSDARRKQEKEPRQREAADDRESVSEQTLKKLSAAFYTALILSGRLEVSHRVSPIGCRTRGKSAVHEDASVVYFPNIMIEIQQIMQS